MLTEIALATGATLIDNEYKIKLKDVTFENFGSAKKIIADMNQTPFQVFTREWLSPSNPAVPPTR
jgi:hypothetical protein